MTDVVVVGAGLSGLTAALHLAEKRLSVAVLERTSEPGGQLRSWNEPGFAGRNDVVLERATHGVWWGYRRLRALLERLDVPLRPRWVNEPHHVVPVVGRDGRIRRYRIGVGLPSVLHTGPLYASVRREIGSGLGVRALAALVSYDPGDCDQTRALDQEDFAAWARRKGIPNRFVSDLAEPLLSMCNFASAEKSSALAWHHYIAAHLPTWRHLRAVQFYADPPSQGLFPRLLSAARAEGVSVHFGEDVERVEIQDGCAVGIWHKGTLRPARHVIVAGAVPSVRRLFGQAPLDRDPFFQRATRLATARPVNVYNAYPEPAHERWKARFGRQEVLFTTGFNTFGTLILASRLRPASTGRSLALIEANLADGERFVGLDDQVLAARVDAELRQVIPGLPAPLDWRVFPSDDFSTARVGSEACRPTVKTPVRGLYVTGDFVKIDGTSFYQERCVISAQLAAQAILEEEGRPGEGGPKGEERSSRALAVLRTLLRGAAT